MIKRDSSLYSIEDFYVYVNQQEALGKRVQSISYFNKKEKIDTLNPFLDIIDLSAYLEIELGNQALFEDLLPLCPAGFEIIANVNL